MVGTRGRRDSRAKRWCGQGCGGLERMGIATFNPSVAVSISNWSAIISSSFFASCALLIVAADDVAAM